MEISSHHNRWQWLNMPRLGVGEVAETGEGRDGTGTGVDTLARAGTVAELAAVNQPRALAAPMRLLRQHCGIICFDSFSCAAHKFTVGTRSN